MANKTASKKAYKNKKALLDKKASIVVYAVTLVIAVMLRSIQLYTNMNFLEGRYYDADPMKNYTAIFLVIGFALIIAVMILGKSKDKAIKSCILINPMKLKYDRLNKKISPKASVAMFAMAAFILFEIFMRLSTVVNENKSYVTNPKSGLPVADDPVFGLYGISLLNWCILTVMVLMIMTFISVGSNMLKGDGITRGNCFFLAFFPIWKLLEIFAMVKETTILGAYSEKVYIMFTAIFSSIFMLNTVRFFGGYEKKNTRILMCISGYMASIFAAVSVIPRYIMLFRKNYDVREGMAFPDTTDVGIIFITITIIAVFWSTYVYRVMPKLTLKGDGKRRWATQSALKDMETIDISTGEE